MMCWRNVGFGRAVIYGGDYLFMGVYADSGGGAVERVRLWPGVVEFAVRQVAPTVTWGYTGGTEQGCKGAGGQESALSARDASPLSLPRLHKPAAALSILSSALPHPHFVPLIIHLTSPNCFFTRIPAVFPHFTSGLRDSVWSDRVYFLSRLNCIATIIMEPLS